MALGYPEGLKSAGADCEFRIYTESTHTTKFADLMWKPVVLIEMKKKDEDLSIHLQQAFSYSSHLVPVRPQYVILCNFFEFRIYDFNLDIYHPQEIVKIEELQNKAEAFSFLFPKSRKPVFNYNRENVTEKVAWYISHTYKSLLKRNKPEIALRYNLQVILREKNISMGVYLMKSIPLNSANRKSNKLKMHSLKTDVSGAKKLKCNRSPKKVFQGQTHGHKGFLVTKSEAKVLLEKHPEYADISWARVTKRPIFQFISSEIRPNDALMVFAFEDDYSFGIINSKYHLDWFKEKCSTLEERLRYTTDSVWDTFPWPQNPDSVQIEEVAKAAKTLRDERNRIMKEHKMSLRDLYLLLKKPGKNPVRDLQDALDRAVSQAYGFDEKGDLLEQLLNLNFKIAEREQNGEPMQAPGLPDWFGNKEKLVSDDCVRFEG